MRWFLSKAFLARSLRRTILVLLLAISLSVGLSCSKSVGPGNDCPSCGSGNVYWDTGVNRCRDHATGRFVSSCCCGH